MRTPESKIKRAIVHRDESVRVAAVSYFSSAFSPDPTVMPLVIQAVEFYGRRTSFRILRAAAGLAQPPAAIDWLLDELRRDYDLADVGHDNYRFAVALALYHAPPEVLLRRKDSIVGLPMFPEALRGPLAERLGMLHWDWDRGWAALQALGCEATLRGGFTPNDVRRACRIRRIACATPRVEGRFRLRRPVVASSRPGRARAALAGTIRRHAFGRDAA